MRSHCYTVECLFIYFSVEHEEGKPYDGLPQATTPSNPPAEALPESAPTYVWNVVIDRRPRSTYTFLRLIQLTDVNVYAQLHESRDGSRTFAVDHAPLRRPLKRSTCPRGARQQNSRTLEPKSVQQSTKTSAASNNKQRQSSTFSNVGCCQYPCRAQHTLDATVSRPRIYPTSKTSPKTHAYREQL